MKLASPASARRRPDDADAPNPSTPSSRRRAPSKRTFVASLTPVVFLLIFVFYAIWLGDTFLALDTRILDLHQNTPLLIAALGLCSCMIAGRFDLSIGGVATLTCFLALGLRSEQGWPFWMVIVSCLVVGIVCGVVNSVLVIGLNVNEFIATLATGGIITGISHVYSGGSPLSPSSDEPGHDIPSWFTGSGSIGNFQSKVPAPLTWLVVVAALFALAMVIWEALAARQSSVRAVPFWVGATAAAIILCVAASTTGLGLPWTVFILFVTAFGLWTIMRYTAFGRELYAIGGNSVAARLAGVRVGARTTAVFMLSGLLAAFAGILLAANQGSASTDIAVPYLLPAFAAVFLSTVLFSTGRFHIWGTVLGGYLSIFVVQGLIAGGLPFTWTDVVSGLVLALAVAFSTALHRTR